ncbi:TM2 domain-containing protein [Lacinutrix neustonica]|uniref:TM2 domain-containing protein n=1 Tax=Lacinutrix neustonica TaxID=2980107 RepID=UPI0028BD9D92|nr:TM2 domain-containing protein [Lacinutrix neustonica]
MSDEKNLNENLDDMLGDAKEGAKKAADKAGEFAEEAKKSAHEFSNSAKETFGSSAENKKLLAGITAILLGWLGVHKFILGYQKEGIIMAAVGVRLVLVWYSYSFSFCNRTC